MSDGLPDWPWLPEVLKQIREHGRVVKIRYGCGISVTHLYRLRRKYHELDRLIVEACSVYLSSPRVNKYGMKPGPRVRRGRSFVK